MIVTEVEFEGRCVSGYDILTGFCVHGNGFSRSIKEGNICNQLSEYQERQSRGFMSNDTYAVCDKWRHRHPLVIAPWQQEPRMCCIPPDTKNVTQLNSSGTAVLQLMAAMLPATHASSQSCRHSYDTRVNVFKRLSNSWNCSPYLAVNILLYRNRLLLWLHEIAFYYDSLTYIRIYIYIYIYIYSLDYLLTPRNRALLEKLTGFELVEKFPAFYGTRRFVTAFTSAHHLSLSWDRSIQSIPPHLTYCRSILILSSHLRLVLPSGLFPSGFPTKTLYTPLLSPHTRYMLSPSHSSRFYHPHNFGWAVQIIKHLIMQFSRFALISFLLGPNILLSTLFSNALNLISSLNVSDQISNPHKITGKIIVLWILIFKFLDTKM